MAVRDELAPQPFGAELRGRQPNGHNENVSFSCSCTSGEAAALQYGSCSTANRAARSSRVNSHQYTTEGAHLSLTASGTRPLRDVRFPASPTSLRDQRTALTVETSACGSSGLIPFSTFSLRGPNEICGRHRVRISAQIVVDKVPVVLRRCTTEVRCGLFGNDPLVSTRLLSFVMAWRLSCGIRKVLIQSHRMCCCGSWVQ